MKRDFEMPLRRRRLLRLLLAAPALPGLIAAARAAEAAVRIPPPAKDLPPAGSAGLQKAVFAGGCFWGVQGVFQHVKGVQRAVSGYAGGTAPTAAYALVSTGRTGHAEAVELSFDPAQVSYGALLQIFFSVAHDPTQLDRQGPDVGPQYRSAIFASGPEQRQVAQAYIAQLDAARLFGKPIVTRLEAGGFFSAEAGHQDFMTENPQHPYIVYHDRPKLDELRRLFPERFRAEPVLMKPRR
jgi:peptide-methionine (S)-S-oxide reductase